MEDCRFWIVDRTESHFSVQVRGERGLLQLEFVRYATDKVLLRIPHKDRLTLGSAGDYQVLRRQVIEQLGVRLVQVRTLDPQSVSSGPPEVRPRSAEPDHYW